MPTRRPRQSVAVTPYKLSIVLYVVVRFCCEPARRLSVWYRASRTRARPTKRPRLGQVAGLRARRATVLSSVVSIGKLLFASGFSLSGSRRFRAVEHGL